MKLIRVLVAGGITVAVCLFFALVVFAPSENGAKPVALSTASSGTAAEPAVLSPPPSAGRLERGHDDVAALRQELALLRTELDALRKGAAPPPPSADAGRAADEQDVRRSPAAHAEAEAVRDAQMAAVESSFRSEPSDPQWSAGTVPVLRQALDSAKIAQSSLRNVECRSQTCRIEIANDGSSDLAKSLPVLANSVGQSLPTVTANQVDGMDGIATTVLYLSRNP